MRTIEETIAITVPEDGLKKKLAKDKPLIVKLGFDPTAPDLHLGHAVVLNKLKDFQDHGHKIVVIIGDYTAQIGDPTGRNATRPPLTEEQVNENSQTYIKQLSKVIDIDKVEIRPNSEWFSKMAMQDIIKLVSRVTLAQMMQRNDFRERFDNDQSISLHELLYPVMQGYDSVAIKADIEIGGTDQLFNCMVGKSLQDTMEIPSQTVICMPLLRGTDGHDKMSKSKNNYIGLTEDADNMFGKVMSIPDELLEEYVDLATNFTQTIKDELHKNIKTDPMSVKKKVAQNVVSIYHDETEATQALQGFENRVQKKSFTEDDYQPVSVQDYNLEPSTPLLELLAALQPDKSKGDLKRLAKGNAIKINNEKHSDLFVSLTSLDTEFTLQIGKRVLFKVTNI